MRIGSNIGVTVKSAVQYSFSDEKWFDQNGQYNRQNDCVSAESREAANKDSGARHVHKFPFKVMVWTEITFQRVTDIVILPPEKHHLMRLFTPKMYC